MASGSDPAGTILASQSVRSVYLARLVPLSGHRTGICAALLFLLSHGSLEANAQSCPVSGGFESAQVSRTFEWSDGQGSPGSLPYGPLPTGESIDVRVDGVGTVPGSCDDYDWNGSECYLARTHLNTITFLLGSWEPPHLIPGSRTGISPRENDSIPEDQFIDSADDTETSDGPVTWFPGIGVEDLQGVGAGTYRHTTTASIAETICDPGRVENPDTGFDRFSVTHTDDATDQECESAGDAIGDPIAHACVNDHLVTVTYPDTMSRAYHYEEADNPHPLTGERPWSAKR
jgi:hypothetical protein